MVIKLDEENFTGSTTNVDHLFAVANLLV